MIKYSTLTKNLRRWWWVALLLGLLAGYWALPITGEVAIVPTQGTGQPLWPQMTGAPANPQPGASFLLMVTDIQPWANVQLTIDGQPARFEDWQAQPLLNRWTWRWRVFLPAADAATEPVIAFYHDCDTGCRLRGRLTLDRQSGEPTAALVDGAMTAISQPTKLCIAFANPAREWHDKQGWVVDMTYITLADSETEPFWRVDAVAARVQQAAATGLNVLLRVEYDQGQTLPPVNDFLALEAYLDGIQRLARDARLQEVHALVIGSGLNALGSSTADPSAPLTPAWYARIFNGYGEPADHMDNVVQIVRAENRQLQLLVGPVRPWILDQTGAQPYTIDTPWLNYMNTLVALLDEGVRTKAAAGIARAAPDGFALQVPGRPDAAEFINGTAAEEPRREVTAPEWPNAQMGFRVYEDWLAIINSYATTRGLPAYITATNTFAPDSPIPPAQNYPPGWLTNAFAVINAEPQVQSLCWFLDLIPGDDRWDDFSLARQPGKLLYTAEEFDALLQK